MPRHADTGLPDTARPAHDAGSADDRDTSRAWVEIDLDALVRNWTAIARATGVPLLPMVKADAYGLGVLPVVRRLLPLAPWGFGVATVREAEQLREAGVPQPIVLFTPSLPAHFPAIRAARVTPLLGSAAVIAAWIDSGGGPWHLGIDTGMSRAGIPWRDIGEVAPLCARHAPEGVATHFHSAELTDGTRETQERRFDEALAALPTRPRLVHAENSAAIAFHGRSRWDLARPGVFLYGVAVGPMTPEPVVAVRARVVEVRRLHPGDTVSYDATWRAGSGARIATVALGYADGYRRAFSNRGVALLHGRRVPVVGNVTMDMTMLDVTGVACEPGDVATLMGGDGAELLTVADVASRAELSPYELLTSLRARLPRLHVEGAGRAPA